MSPGADTRENSADLPPIWDQDGVVQKLLVNLRAHEELLLLRFAAVVDQKFRDHFGQMERHLNATSTDRGTDKGAFSPVWVPELDRSRQQFATEPMPNMRLATSPAAPLRGDLHADPPEQPDALPLGQIVTPSTSSTVDMKTDMGKRSVKFGDTFARDSSSVACGEELASSGIAVPPATLAMKEAAARNFTNKGDIRHAVPGDLPIIDGDRQKESQAIVSVTSGSDSGEGKRRSLGEQSTASARWTTVKSIDTRKGLSRDDNRKTRRNSRSDGLELAKGWFKDKQQGFCIEEELDEETSEINLLSPQQRKIRALFQGTKLLWVVGAVLTSHAIFVCLQAQWTLEMGLDRAYGRDMDEKWRGVFLLVVNAFFLVLYITEMCLRAYVQKRQYYLGPDRGWNIISGIVTLLDIIGLLIQVGMSPLDKPDVGFMIGQAARAIRFLRIFQVMGSLQHDLFHEVRLILLSIYGSISAFIWAFLIMALVMFIAGILMLQGVVYHLWDTSVDMHTATVQPTNLDGQDVKLDGAVLIRALEKYYGSVLTCMITLFQAISGGIDWSEGMLPLYAIAWSYKIFFTFFIAIGTCWILNVLTGVFVNVAMRRWQVDSDTAVQLELRRNETYVKAIKGMFNDLDVDHSGTISLQELEDHLKNPRVQAYFKNLELDVSEARGLFVLLDTEEKNEVDIEEFCVGCMRLKGTAKSIDMATLLYENKKVMLKICNNTQFMEDQFHDLFQLLQGSSTC